MRAEQRRYARSIRKHRRYERDHGPTRTVTVDLSVDITETIRALTDALRALRPICREDFILWPPGPNPKPKQLIHNGRKPR